MTECSQQIQDVLTYATYVLLGLVAAGVGLIWNSGRGPELDKPKRPAAASSYELCKLHQRPVDECRDMHDGGDDESA